MTICISMFADVQEYEQRVRERMHQEASKAVTYTKQANESLNESVEKTHGDAETKEKAALVRHVAGAGAD